MVTACGAASSSSSLGIAGEWTVHNGRRRTDIEKIVVKEGDTVDFITDCREHVTSDSFAWRVELTLTDEEGVASTFRSHEGFHGPLANVPPWKSPASSGRGNWRTRGFRPATSCNRRASSSQVSANTCAFTRSTSAAGRSPETQALANLCHALLSSNEFLYVD